MSQYRYPQHPGTAHNAPDLGPGGAQGQDQGWGVPYPGMPHHDYYQAYRQPNRSLFGMPNDRFLKGMLIGAAATYLLTNEQVQRTLIKGVVKAWSLLQGGIEEVKERFGDAAAELQHNNQGKAG